MKFFFRSDRRALLWLFTLILAVWAGVIIDRKLLRKPAASLPALDEMAMDSLSRQGVQPSSHRPSGSDAVRGDYSAAKRRYASSGEGESPDALQAETFAFDPNTADAETLSRLGLAPWQVKSILTYRSRGGRYHRTEDFKRVPGMTPEVYERLAPVIRIGRAFRYYEDNELRADSKGRNERQAGDLRKRDSSATFPHIEKFKELTIVDINSADTALLKRIPGIASYRARQIIRYRERLGGFASIEQLAEIEGMPADELANWFNVGSGVYRRININKATVAEMGKHPYIGFARARAINDYRHNFGTLHDLNELSLVNGFDEKAIQRLRPYVEY